MVMSFVLPADGPRGASGFTSGRRPNWGGLLLKEKAALRKLEKAQEDLKASRQRRDPALRAGGRGAGANRVFPAAQPVYMPLSDSEVVPGLITSQSRSLSLVFWSVQHLASTTPHGTV